MCGRYTLEWLDSLITISLNPLRTNLDAILPEQIIYLGSKIEEKKIEHQSFLKNEVFSLLEESQIRLLIKQYHSALIILLDQAFENYTNISTNKHGLKQLANEVITCIDELVCFIEVRFSIYIGKEEHVAVTYLSKTKKEVKEKTEKLRIELEKIKDKQVTDIVLNILYSFSKSNKDIYPVTFQEVSYIKELLNELGTLEHHERENDIFTNLDKILIYMNFNSEIYINYLTQKIARKIDAFGNISDKIDYLQFHFKEFNQLHRKAGIALYSQQTDLKDELGNWFKQEICYLEKKLHLSMVSLQPKPENPSQKTSIEKEKSKVLCILSTDQMGIILRAFNELKVVKARSMTEVFKTIVPHLSTPHKADLSYDSMRSKSYAAEQKDKKIVIETLQQVIEKIKRY